MNDGLILALRAEQGAHPGLSYERWAQLSGVPKRTLTRYLTGETPITIPNLARLAAVLDVKPSYLMLEAERRIEQATGRSIVDMSREDVRELVPADLPAHLRDRLLSEPHPSPGRVIGASGN